MTGVAAGRPKRIAWTDALTIDGAAVVGQGEGRFLYEGSGDVVMQQEFEVSVSVIDSDDAIGSVETRAGQLASSIIEAMEADPTCGGHAMYGGLVIGETGEDRDGSGRMTGKTISLTVTYSHLASDPTVKGIR